jgi:hypothetical protein
VRKMNIQSFSGLLLAKNDCGKHRGFISKTRHYCSSIGKQTGKSTSKAICISLTSVLIVSFLAFAMVGGAITSSQTIHMMGSIAYPTPTPTSNQNNLAPLSVWGYGPYSSKYSTVTWQGKTAIKLLNYGQPFYDAWHSAIEREVDSPGIKIKPGDVIVFNVWLWTEASTQGDTGQYSGASIEIDPFVGSGRICAVNLPIGTLVGTGIDSGSNSNIQAIVPWGSGRWVQMSMTWTVPKYVYSDGCGIGGQGGGPYTPDGMIAIIQGLSYVNPPNEGAAVYIADPQIFIQ